MTDKQRIQTTLNHKEPDIIPIDFGGTGQTGMHVSCIEQLRDYYGLEKRTVIVEEPYQMLGRIEEDLQEVIGIDTLPVNTGGTMFGFKNTRFKPWKAPWGQELLVAEKFNTTLDENGDVFIYPQGDNSIEPSAVMPASGFFFDALNRQEPFDENELNWKDNTEEFSLLNEKDIQDWKKTISYYENSTKALIGNIGGTALGDIALVPAVQLKHPKGIRDISEWYMSTMIRQDYIHRIFQKQTDIALENLEKLKPILANKLEAVFICGTDFGTQTSTFCAVETFQELWMPYYKRINDWIHKNTAWKTFKHCCGSIKSFIPSFIESGFDILNPVQCSAADMDPLDLKKEFGKDIVFWGGGVDTQKTLPFGIPEEVRKEVLKRCEIFSPGGGFVFSSIHNILANTPVENIVAMINAVKEFNGKA